MIGYCRCGTRIDTAGQTACWRHRARQRPAMHRGGGSRRDPVTPAVYAAVRARDGGCVAARAGFPDGLPCEGRLEEDHVLNGGLSLRGLSTEDNLVTLCSGHHRFKTEHANLCRRLLVAWIASRSRP